ncbi:MAG: Ig-like domain-containing protein [Oscillospiraceae bacterium]|nr:Ig-like domain-containing protein [Oscillospiraceae bacterium]
MKFNKKIVSLLIVVGIVVTTMLSVMPAGATDLGNVTEFGGGFGTFEKPYLIKTQQQLVNMGDQRFLASNFRLENDINLQGWWTPIGASATNKAFSGVFNGQNFTISNLNVTGTARMGLFGQTNNATITNLNIVGGTVTATATASYVGTIVGYAQNSLFLTNCTVNVAVVGKQHTGGLVGYGQRTIIRDCTFMGTVRGTTNVGGIIGKAIKVAATDIAIISRTSVVLPPNADSSLISIIGTTGDVGGIAGEMTGRIEQCFTNVKIHGTTRVGGIAGSLVTTASTPGQIFDSYSTGEVLSLSGGSTGGIAGNSTGNSSIKQLIARCYSTADVISVGSGRKTGGIVGDNGTSTSWGNVEKSVAINRLISQTSAVTLPTGTVNIGRVAGTPNGNYSGTHHLNTIPIVNSSPLSTYKGTDATPQNLATVTSPSFYINLGWDFNPNSVWVIDTNYSIYPILQWQLPTPIPGVILTYDHGDSVEILEEESFDLLATPTLTSDSIANWVFDSSLLSGVITDDSIKLTALILPGNQKEVTTTVSVVTSQGATESIQVVIKIDKVHEIKELAVALEVGDSVYVGGLDFKNEIIENTGYTWESNRPDVATVSINGKVTAVGLGVAEITGTRGRFSSTITIIVREAPILHIEKITFSTDYVKSNEVPNSISNYINGEMIWTGRVIDFMSIEPLDVGTGGVRWFSENEDYATVNTTTGLIAIEGYRQVSIRAESAYDSSIYARIIIDTSPDVSLIEIVTPDGTSVKENNQLSLAVDTTPDGAYSVITWSSSNENIATVDQYGIVTGKSRGIVRITATTLNGKSDYVDIEVTPDIDFEEFMLAGFKDLLAPQLSNPIAFIANEGMYSIPGGGGGLARLDFKGIAYATRNDMNGFVANNWQGGSPKAFAIMTPTNDCTSFKISFTKIAIPLTSGGAIVTEFELQYSVDDINWVSTPALSYSINTTHTTIVKEFEIPSTADTLFLRWCSTSPGDGTDGKPLFGAQTRVGINNIEITGTRFY